MIVYAAKLDYKPTRWLTSDFCSERRAAYDGPGRQADTRNHSAEGDGPYLVLLPFPRIPCLTSRPSATQVLRWGESLMNGIQMPMMMFSQVRAHLAGVSQAESVVLSAGILSRLVPFPIETLIRVGGARSRTGARARRARRGGL